MILIFVSMPMRRKQYLFPVLIGNGAMMVRTFPHGAVQFLSYEHYKQVLNHAGIALKKIKGTNLALLEIAASKLIPREWSHLRISFTNSKAQHNNWHYKKMTVSCKSQKLEVLSCAAQ